MQPKVSVVIATYNRPGVLRYAISSVLRSDFDDWEMIVVGDGCTDNTEETVASFGDPRIRFVNLETNSGGQSAPSNEGIRLARGKYVCFLNHDDMYFPDHLSASVAFMERTGADLAWSPTLQFSQSGKDEGPADVTLDKLILRGAVSEGAFDPTTFVIASSWIVRRETFDKVGPWLDASQTRLSPSQEWIFRASRSGIRMLYHPHVSVLCIYSGYRRYSYIVSQSPDHERAWSWITEPGGLDRAFHCVALLQAAGVHRLENPRVSKMRFRRFVRVLMRAMWLRLGIHPHAADLFFKGRGKGNLIARHRKATAQPPSLTGEIKVGSKAASVFLGRGWRRETEQGRWTDLSRAEIFFHVPKAEEGRVLEVYGHPRQLPGEVSFALNDGPPMTRAFEREETPVRIPIAGSGNFRLDIHHPPKGGFWASRLRMTRDGAAGAE